MYLKLNDPTAKCIFKKGPCPLLMDNIFNYVWGYFLSYSAYVLIHFAQRC